MGKYLISLRVTNSIVKLLFIRFRITNSKLKNKKFPEVFEREVDKWKMFLKYYSFKMTWTASFYYVYCI